MFVGIYTRLDPQNAQAPKETLAQFCWMLHTGQNV